MNLDKTTIGGYATALGAALLAGGAALPATGYENIKTSMLVLGAVLATFGPALLGHSASDSSKTVTIDQMEEQARRKPGVPLKAEDFIDPGPPPEKKEAPPSSDSPLPPSR